MDVLIGLQPNPYPLTQHVTSRRVTRQTTQGDTSITETFTEVIMDTWADVDQDPRRNVTRQFTTSQSQVDPAVEFWTEAVDPLSGEVSQVQHSSGYQFQDSRSQDVISRRAPRRTGDQLPIMELEMLTGMETTPYRGQYRSESQTMPGYAATSSMYRSLPSSNSSASTDARFRPQGMSFQNEPKHSPVTGSYQSVDPNLQTIMGASLRDDDSRYQSQNMPTYQPTRTTTQSYGSNQSDQLMQVPLEPSLGLDSSQSRDRNRYQPTRTTTQSYGSNQSDQLMQAPLEPFLGLDSSQSRDRNRFVHQRFRSPNQIDTLSMSDPTLGDQTRRSTGRYQFTDASQFSRPPPNNNPFPSTQTNIMTGVESQYQGQHSSLTSIRSRTARDYTSTPMPYPSSFERNSSTGVSPGKQSNYPTHASNLAQNRTAQASQSETYWPTSIKVEPHEREEYQYVSSQVSPQIASGQFDPPVLPPLPTSMASIAEGMPQTQSQYIPEYSSNRAQPSHPNLSDPTDPFSVADMDIFTGADTSRYQGQFISAPFLTEHQTQQSNLPDPLTYPFLGANMDTTETQIASLGDNNSYRPFSESNLIKIEPTDQSTLDSSLAIDLEASNTEMPNQSYDISTPSLPEASSQTLQGVLPNLNAYPSLAAAIDALAEMEIAGHQSSQASMPAANDPNRFRVGTPQAQNQSQIFDPMSSQFNRASTSSSVRVQQLQRPSSIVENLPAASQTPPESERQRVARLLKEFLKNSSKWGGRH